MICCLLKTQKSESDDECDPDYLTSHIEDTDENVREQETIDYFPVVGSNWAMHYQDGLLVLPRSNC